MKLACNGISLFVHEWRAKEPRGVAVLIHGIHDVGASFDLVAPALFDAGLDVFAPDMRGFGESDRVAAGGYYHFMDYLFDLADALEALSPNAPSFLVGHSMGSTIAALYAGTFPSRVSRLALLEGVGPPDFGDEGSPDRVKHWIDGVRKVRAREERPITFDEAVSRLAMGHPKVSRELLVSRTRLLTKETGDGRVVWRFDPLHRTTSPYGFSVSRWRAHAARITAPTLVIGGGPDGFHPDDEAARVAVIPNARFVEIEGAGHMMHWTKPNELASLLVEHAR